MRAMLMLGLLMVAGIAGCLQQPAATTPDAKAAVAKAIADYKVPAVPKVDAKALLADHAAFVTKNNERAANKPTHESARVDLLEHFKSYGLDTYRFNFTTGIPQADIMGIKWGVDREHWVFVGGHYDTVTDDCLVSTVPVVNQPNPCALRTLSQGAYDDGSGTMMTVHLAKAWANVTPYYTIAFVAYDGEERGIQGAAAIVNVIQEGNFTFKGVTPTIVGDLDLDMLGINWPGTMAPINMLDNTKVGAALVKAKAKEMGFPDSQLIEKASLKLGSSDYSAFWGVKEPQTVPTIFFISDFEEIGAPAPAPGGAYSPAGAYPFWHLEDTVATMTAMAGGQSNLESGFQSASDLASYVIHFLAADPAHPVSDAVAR
jgi:Zn-dependent M28 family amino/carboxypeptidase